MVSFGSLSNPNEFNFILNKQWGIGQVQSIIKEKVTVNFENVGKKVINSNNILLRKLEKNELKGN